MEIFDWQAEQRQRTTTQTIFFTDRAIYRPGQTIQYKGISLMVNQNQDNYEVLKGEQLTVLFNDVNGKEVITQFPMDPLNELGLLKMDFLGLKTLTGASCGLVSPTDR